MGPNDWVDVNWNQLLSFRKCLNGRLTKTYLKEKIDQRTIAVGGEGYFGVVFHTGGVSGDGPRMGWGRDDENSDLVIEPGMVFTIKPRVPIPGVKTPNCQIGDAVLIREAGAERLGRRRLEPILIS